MRFYKMSGSGNDFVFLDGRTTEPGEWPVGRIREACDRRSGIGADGLVILSPGERGLVRMHFYNSDGSRAAMCGNAALCSTRLAGSLGMAGSDVTLETDAGSFQTRCVGPGWQAELNLPPFEAPVAVPEVELVEGELFLTRATVGVPHLAVQVGDIEAPGLMQRGKALRHHSVAGRGGANANFVARPPAEGEPWPIRTYERGVEAETLACGTGTVAVAASLMDHGVTTSPQAFLTRGGQILAVSGRREGAVWTDVWLRGEGRLVFSGEMPGLLIPNRVTPSITSS
jgi:diaminopimelate epimerase